MNDRLARVIGERVRLHRTAARRTKTVVAGLTGITPDYLYQIERGLKVPTVAVLAQLAEVLGVSVGDLLDQAPARPVKLTKAAAGEAIYRALTGPMLTTSEPRPLPELRSRGRERVGDVADLAVSLPPAQPPTARAHHRH